MSIITLFFSPNGRIRRRDWWWASIGLLVIETIIELTGYTLITGKSVMSYWDAPSPSLIEGVDSYAIFSWTMTALSIWPGFCVSIKRWHDRNRTGWIGFIILAVTYIVMLKDAVTTAPWNLYMFFIVVAVAGSLWQLVECGILDGTRGPNRYGPSPKGIEASADVF